MHRQDKQKDIAHTRDGNEQKVNRCTKKDGMVMWVVPTV